MLSACSEAPNKGPDSHLSPQFPCLCPEGCVSPPLLLQAPRAQRGPRHSLGGTQRLSASPPSAFSVCLSFPIDRMRRRRVSTLQGQGTGFSVRAGVPIPVTSQAGPEKWADAPQTSPSLNHPGPPRDKHSACLKPLVHPTKSCLSTRLGKGLA